MRVVHLVVRGLRLAQLSLSFGGCSPGGQGEGGEGRQTGKRSTVRMICSASLSLWDGFLPTCLMARSTWGMIPN